MTTAIVYGFAAAPPEDPPPELPRPLLARQLPRLAVHLLNGGADRGLRFFPLIGREGAERGFLVLEELLAVDTLLGLHGQTPPPRFVVDGRVADDCIRLRVHDGRSGRACFDSDLPFDPGDPFGAVSRLMFELAGVFRWPGAPPRVPGVAGGAMRDYLVARDHLLELEAELAPPGDTRMLDIAVQALEGAPADGEVQQLLVDLCVRFAPVRAGEVAEAIDRACTSVQQSGALTASFAASTAGLLEACGREARALARYREAIECDPSHAQAASRTATLLFNGGEPEQARDVLMRALDGGPRSRLLVAQLAVLEQQLGNDEAHGCLIEELLELGDRRPPVVRMIVSHLLERERAPEALAVVEECLAEAAEDPGPWFDKGRALLACEEYPAAREALQRCLDLEPVDPLRREVRRHIRLAQEPELMNELAGLAGELASGARAPLVRRARKLVRAHSESPEAWLFLGIVQQKAERRFRAERAFHKALALDPDLGEAHNRLGILLVGKGRHQDGYEHLRRAIALMPNEASAHIHLAQACRALGRIAEAREALDWAMRLGGVVEMIESVRRTLRDNGV